MVGYYESTNGEIRGWSYADNAGNPDADPVLIEAVSFKQKTKEMYSGVIKAFDAFRLTTVPRIEYKAAPKDTVSQVLAGNLDKYQRPVLKKKQKEIKDWFLDNSAHIANSVLMHLTIMEAANNEADFTQKINGGFGAIREVYAGTNSQAVEMKIPVVKHPGHGGTQIIVRQSCDHSGTPFETGHAPSATHFPKAVYTKAGEWFDTCLTCEWSGRPGEMVDGQHRVIGATRSAKRDELIPANILFGDSFDSSRKAKIFTEITTKTTALHDLHILNLAYRSSPKRKVQIATDEFDLADSRIAALYEVGAKLTKEGSILKNRIMLLPKDAKGGSTVGKMASIAQFVKWTKDYVRIPDPHTGALGGVFNKVGVLTSSTNMRETIENWFKAVSETDWGGKSHGDLWKATRRPNGNIQKPAQTEVLLRILGPVIEKLEAAGVVGVPTKADFKKITTYLSEFNLEDSSPMMRLSGAKSGEKNRTGLLLIMTSVINDIPVSAVPALYSPASRRGKMAGGSHAWLTTAPRPGERVDAFTITSGPAVNLSAAAPAAPFEVTWEVTAHDILHTKPPCPANALNQKATILLRLAGADDWTLGTEVNGSSFNKESMPPLAPGYAVGDNVDLVVRFDTYNDDFPSVEQTCPAVI